MAGLGPKGDLTSSVASLPNPYTHGDHMCTDDLGAIRDGDVGDVQEVRVVCVPPRTKVRPRC